jgi:cytochrome b involved in lipid metabolism
VIVLTPAEIAKHSTKRDCWAIYSGSVYDISSFTTHPGGNVYVPYCGKDMTRAFNQQGHSTRAENLLASFFLGTLNSTISVSSASG